MRKGTDTSLTSSSGFDEILHMKRIDDDEQMSRLKRACGRRLRLAREAMGYTNARKFAELHLRISKERLNHYEQGRHFPAPDVLVKLERKFGIDSSWVLHGKLTGLPHHLIEPVELLASKENETI